MSQYPVHLFTYGCTTPDFFNFFNRWFRGSCWQDGWFSTTLRLPFSNFWSISGYAGVFLSIFPHLMTHYVHWGCYLVYDDAAIMHMLKTFMGTVIVSGWPRNFRTGGRRYNFWGFEIVLMPLYTTLCLSSERRE